MDELDKWIASEFIDDKLGFFYLFEGDSGTIVQMRKARLTLTVDNDLEWTFESIRKKGDKGIFEDWALVFGYAPFSVPALTWDWDHGFPLLTDESGETRPFEGKIGGKVRLLQTV